MIATINSVIIPLHTSLQSFLFFLSWWWLLRLNLLATSNYATRLYYVEWPLYIASPWHLFYKWKFVPSEPLSVSPTPHPQTLATTSLFSRSMSSGVIDSITPFSWETPGKSLSFIRPPFLSRRNWNQNAPAMKVEFEVWMGHLPVWTLKVVPKNVILHNIMVLFPRLFNVIAIITIYIFYQLIVFSLCLWLLNYNGILANPSVF